MNNTVIEAIGYIGSALVLVSFLMSSVVKLRIVNTVGSLIFAVYALIIKSYPTAIMNICLVCINLYYLWKLRHKDSSYRLVELRPDEGFVVDFLKNNAEDIAGFFPDRAEAGSEANRAYAVFHGAEPAGLMLGREEDGVLDVALDYSTPAFRDCSVGKFLLGNLPRPLLLRYRNAEETHLKYLKSLGFVEKDGVWERNI